MYLSTIGFKKLNIPKGKLTQDRSTQISTFKGNIFKYIQKIYTY